MQHPPTQDQILERKNKQKRGVRTPFHGRHSIDIPSGEITVEFSGGMEHCTSHRNKKKSKIKTNIKSVCNTTKGNQQRKKEMYGYVLYCMVVTAATFHAEREPLNLAAYWNTAPQVNNNKFDDQMWQKVRRKLVDATKEREKECTYFAPWSSQHRHSMRKDHCWIYQRNKTLRTKHKEVQRLNGNGWRGTERHIELKIKLSKEANKKDPSLERGRDSEYVLTAIFVTLPTSHLEMSSLNVPLLKKTLDMSVTKETSQSWTIPYLAMVATESKVSTACLIPQVRTL